MGSHSSAAVIDLQEFRQKRERRPAAPQPSTQGGTVPVLVWVMVWPAG